MAGWWAAFEDTHQDLQSVGYAGLLMLYGSVVCLVSWLKPTRHAFENFLPTGWRAGGLPLNRPLTIYSLWDMQGGCMVPWYVRSVG